MTEDLLVALAVITVLGVGAQWLAWRLGLPSILLLLLFGFAVGNATPLVHPDEMFGDLLFPVVSLSVALILFEGGLSLRMAEAREVGRIVFRLVVFGALVTWAIASLAAAVLLPLTPELAVLLGAIVVVTGPTVVGPILQHVRPKRPVGPILKWEGIVIDPIGAMLAVLVFEAILSGQLAQGLTTALTGVVTTILAGTAVGGLAAWALLVVLRRWLVPDFLQNPIALMAVVAAFAVSDVLKAESGLFAAPLMGMLIANSRRVAVRHIAEFQESVRVLLLAGLFIVLGARVELASLTRLGWGSFAFLAVLILVARPLSVAVATVRSKLDLRQRVFMAAMAPRGVVAAAVSSLFAIRLAEAGRPVAERIVPETFIVIVGTVAVYGLLASPLARLLKISTDRSGTLIIGAYAWAREMASALQSEGQTVHLVDTNQANVKAANMAGLQARRVDALSERSLDKLDLDGIGRVFAMTSNDEFNALAALHFTEAFERSGVFQLHPQRKAEDHQATHLRGRLLFGPDVTFERLTVRFAAGAQVRATPITERFDAAAWRERYGRSATPLFIIGEQGELTVFTSDGRPDPRPGSTLIAIVDNQPARQTTEERRQRSLWRRLRTS